MGRAYSGFSLAASVKYSGYFKLFTVPYFTYFLYYKIKLLNIMECLLVILIVKVRSLSVRALVQGSNSHVERHQVSAVERSVTDSPGTIH